jgi:hypothetical protein
VDAGGPTVKILGAILLTLALVALVRGRGRRGAIGILHLRKRDRR